MERVCRRLWCSQVASRISSFSVRNTFLDYFQQNHGHVLLPSSSTLPSEDSTTAFISSGMQNFKPLFLEQQTMPWKRVVNSQKCVRIKGKFDDTAVVGQDGIHHTFFEMLGNWSFDDYQKKEACSMAWELLTKVYGIPSERLYITYFSGDKELGLEPDLETLEIWQELGVKKDRILPFGRMENFWDNIRGPCGPCTEIHYDHVGGRDASLLVNAGTEEVIELWNLVFISYSRSSDELTLQKLNKTFVDTGMGFERMVAVMQKKRSNYDTDLFAPLMAVISRTANVAPYGTREDMDIAYRVVADHARMLTVTLSDGMLPNVHTKIRAAFTRARTIIDKVFAQKRGLISELTNYVAESLSPVYPEIGANLERVKIILDKEEDLYWKKESRMTEEYLNLLKNYSGIEKLEVDRISVLTEACKFINKKILRKGLDSISPEHAWILKSTYGMEPKLIEDLSAVLGLKFNRTEFDNDLQERIKTVRMEIQKEYNSARKSTLREKLQSLRLPATDDRFKYDYVYDGNGNYTFNAITAKVLAIVNDENELIESVDSESLEENPQFALILDRTNLFPSTRRNMAEDGTFHISDDVTFKVLKAVGLSNYVLHWGHFQSVEDRSWKVSVNCEGRLSVNESTRRALMRGFTAEHILATVLREKVALFTESNSRASPDYVQTFFMYYSSEENIKDSVIAEVEEKVAEIIRTGGKVSRKLYSPMELTRLAGVPFKFDHTTLKERLPVVDISNLSRRVCEGVHVEDVSHVEDFLIIGKWHTKYRLKELVAVTGPAAAVARKRGEDMEKTYSEISEFPQSTFEDPNQMDAKIRSLTDFLLELRSRRTLIPSSVRSKLLNDLLTTTKSLKTKLDAKSLKTKLDAMSANAPVEGRKVA